MKLQGGCEEISLNNSPGVFFFPEYQQLYESCIASGTRSPLDALKVGAKIEGSDGNCQQVYSEQPRAR